MSDILLARIQPMDQSFTGLKHHPNEGNER